MDQLIEKILRKKNPIVVGLDTRLEYLPHFLIQKYGTHGHLNFCEAAKAILEFNMRIIDAVSDLIPAVKIQLACYELYGVEGIKALSDTIRYAKQNGLTVIGDGKRNDIGDTAKAYSSAYLGQTSLLAAGDRAFEMDAMTVNPYLGSDGITPFIEDCRNYDKDIFVLVKTSNPSAGELQDRMTEGKRIYEVVADQVSQWGRDTIGKFGFSKVGAVVGATWPRQAARLRQRMPHTFFLVPGYGVQGGDADDIAGCFDKNGMGAVVHASRSILRAYRSSPHGCPSSKYFAAAAREEVLRMAEDIENTLLLSGKKPW